MSKIIAENDEWMIQNINIDWDVKHYIIMKKATEKNNEESMIINETELEALRAILNTME